MVKKRGKDVNEAQLTVQEIAVKKKKHPYCAYYEMLVTRFIRNCLICTR